MRFQTGLDLVGRFLERNSPEKSLQGRDEKLGTCGPSLHSSKMAILQIPKEICKVNKRQILNQNTMLQQEGKTDFKISFCSTDVGTWIWNEREKLSLHSGRKCLSLEGNDWILTLHWCRTSSTIYLSTVQVFEVDPLFSATPQPLNSPTQAHKILACKLWRFRMLPGQSMRILVIGQALLKAAFCTMHHTNGT